MTIAGVGLGLRWDFLEEVVDGPPLPVDFFEVSPENYMRRGGYFPDLLERVRDRYPLVSHGLSLSLGGVEPPDRGFVSELRRELERLRSPFHSDHLSSSGLGRRFVHELLPLRFDQASARRVADRVRGVQDALGLPMALENITYYAHPGRPEMSEAEFILSVLDASGCGLLLDVNNAYVNAENHGGRARDFLAQMPFERVVEIHVAGHTRTERGLILDTHAAPVSDPVLELLEWTLKRAGQVPVLLERDHEVPPLSELLAEIETLRAVVTRARERAEAVP